ncbi:MAG: PP2C family protein-serine/threonine phosphatase [Planctomycetota bacterium]
MSVPPPPPETVADSAAADPRVRDMVELVRELSAQTDAQTMVSDFGERFRQMFRLEGFVAVSRRGLDAPWYRVTRSTAWEHKLNPWKQSDLLPLMRGGLLGRLLYAEEPVIDNDFHPDPDDPAYEHLKGHRSFMAVPHYDAGRGLNLAVNLDPKPGAFDPLTFADRILTHNLFGRATNHLATSQKLAEANAALDAELKVVGDIQRSLLPQTLPDVPRLTLAAHYATATRAGGDYYDLFPLPDGRWGVLVADVSGHGTPAAVVMAATHAIAHAYTHDLAPGACQPCGMLTYLNQRLTGRYDADTVMFVTAFYGVFNPDTLELAYAAAGHPPPRLCRGDHLEHLDAVGGLPLGVTPDSDYHSATTTLQPGDELLMFTDGITEAFNPQRQQYGDARLDAVLRGNCPPEPTPAETICAVLDDVAAFTHGTANDDDRTLLALRVE